LYWFRLISLDNSNFKHGEAPNESLDDIEKPWKEKVVALEKINKVLREEINELGQEVQSTTEILNQAKNKLQECKANEMKVEKELNIKINDLNITRSQLERLIAEESKLKSSSMIKNKEFEQKMSEQQKKIESLQIAEQTFKNKEATIAVLRERLQANLNTFQNQKKANEQILDEKNDLESKIDFSNEDHSFFDSLSTVSPSPKCRNFVLKKQSTVI